MSQPKDGDSRSGFFLALITYLLWGFLPVYFKAIPDVPLLEVIAHRVIWALPIALVVLVILGKSSNFMSVLRDPHMLKLALLPTLFVSINWAVYVWAVASGHALDAALGYYINPLFSVLLGSILLKERLNALQWSALGAAAIGVAILTWENGSLPLVALALTLSWGFYAYFKRALPLEPNQGFTLEISILMPFAVVLAGYYMISGEGHFALNLRETLLLIGCGLITAGPLLLYANSAKRLRLSTIAMMQYISPTMIFLIAVFLFKEPFSQVKLLAFGFIWSALAIFTIGSLRK